MQFSCRLSWFENGFLAPIAGTPGKPGINSINAYPVMYVAYRREYQRANDMTKYALSLMLRENEADQIHVAHCIHLASFILWSMLYEGTTRPMFQDVCDVLSSIVNAIKCGYTTQYYELLEYCIRVVHVLCGLMTTEDERCPSDGTSTPSSTQDFMLRETATRFFMKPFARRCRSSPMLRSRAGQAVWPFSCYSRLER